MPRPPLDRDGDGAARLRTRLSGVRSAGGDSHRQWGALRDVGDSRSLVPDRVVDAVGIIHQRIHPGCPQENGAHERMHRTLKRRAVKPVQRTCVRQQRQFDAFRLEYNTERPHERLGHATPASRYHPSPRPYPERLTPIEYPGHFVVKKVTTGGKFRSQTRLLYLAKAMVDQHVGLEKTDDGIWRFTSTQCCWQPSTSATTSSRADTKCYLCPQTL